MKDIEIGPIRPPSESNSLLIRVTRGTWLRSASSCCVNPFSLRAFCILRPSSFISSIGTIVSLIIFYRYEDGKRVKHTVTPVLGEKQHITEK